MTEKRLFEKCMVDFCTRPQTKRSAALGLPKMCTKHAEDMSFLVWVMSKNVFAKQWPSGLIKPP